MQRHQSSTRSDGAPDEREPEDGEDRLGQARPVRDDEELDDGDLEVGVAHRANPLPLREEEEEELSEADIMDELDMKELDVKELDADDLAKLEGTDA
jgi:hypothetical protein